MTAHNFQEIKALNYVLEPDSEQDFIDFLNKYFPDLDLAELLAAFETLLAPCSTPPEQKEIRFINKPFPWLRVQFYSANYWDENNGLALARIFRFEGDQLIVEHEYFVLPEIHRGQNIGKKLIAVSLEHYEKIGVEEIRVFAGLSAGGAVWARAGFKAVDKNEMDAILGVSKINLSVEQYQDVKAIYDLYYTSEPNGTAFPIKDWVLLGFMDETLKQVDWHGRIDLTDEIELTNFKSMLTAKNNLKEAPYIADELLDDALELESRCETIERTVSGHAFSLDRALKLYGVDMDSYIDYLTDKHAKSYSGQLADHSKVLELSGKLKAAEKLLRAMFGNAIDHDDLIALMKSYAVFSKRVIRKQELIK